jgi:hypothetical protein
VEKEAVRILGSWIGNGISQAGVWSRVLDKINNSLKQWGKSHPTMFGRRLIVQMIVGGMTQYLTKAQGMPKEVEKSLEKSIRQFIWDDRKPPVSLKTLHLPIQKGGIKLLDLGSRNKAIEIIWLKSFLSLDQTRPTWAYVADALIGESITKNSGNVSKLAQINIYLQSWKPGLHPVSTLPQNIRKMLKTGKEFNLNFEALKLPDSLKMKLPAWYHIWKQMSQGKPWDKDCR